MCHLQRVVPNALDSPECRERRARTGTDYGIHRLPCAHGAPGPAGSRRRERREKRETGRKILARAGIACLVVLFAFEQCYGTAAQYAACDLSASEYSNRIAELEEYYEDYPTDNGFARTGQTCVYYGSSKYNGPDCTGLVLSGPGSFDLYSSTQENSVQNLLMRLGYSKKTPFGTAYQSPNTAAGALLSVTNVIAEEQPPETELVADHAQKLYGSYRDWKTTSSMPLGYGIAATAEETELANKADYSGSATDATDDEPTDAWSANPFNNQIAMYASATGADASGLYHKATAVDAESTSTTQRDFTVTTTSAGPLSCTSRASTCSTSKRPVSPAMPRSTATPSSTSEGAGHATWSTRARSTRARPSRCQSSRRP